MPDLEERVAALEAEQAQLREEWAVVATAPLIQARVLNALRETQVEHGERLTRIEEALEAHGRLLAEHGQGLQTIISMLGTLIDREGSAST